MAKPHESITLERITEAVKSDCYIGFCLLCGEEADGVEPDARRYRCDNCGNCAVFGAEELLLYMA